MTLKASEESALFYAENPPQTGEAPLLANWADAMFRRLAGFLRRPEFPAIVLTRIDTVVQPEFFKAEDGMLIYAGSGVLGPQEGLYVRESGTWKKLAGT